MNTHSYTISAEQRNELETLITNGDRVGFYIALHNMTGSEAALDMAEIASSSGLRGGTAWALNSAYADVLDGYPAGGVTAFSIEIAASALASIEARPDGTYEVPSDIRTYENAKAAWNLVGLNSGVPNLGDKYFPGNIMIAQHHMLLGNPSDAWQAAGMESYIATGAGAGLLFWEALTEIAADDYNHTASLNDFLQQNAGTSVETFTSVHDAHLTVIKDAAGKTIGVIRGDGPLGIAGQFVEGMSSLLRPYADALNSLGRWIGQTLPIPHAVDLVVNTQYKSSRLNSSPLILDLDGDGIEITPLSGAITFDHDADGVRTGTAWAGADDGLLVLDLDGNGLIDSGRELFGNNTLLANGQKAADGYAALRALDANTDGLIDALDAEFVGLRVWRDLDQDGVSDAGELQSLEEAGISQIDLNKTAFTQTLADGTRLDGQANFTLNGQTHTYTDAWFAENPFYREFTTAIESSSLAAVLPDMQGSGAVRDLREAATLSPLLNDLLTQFATASTRDAQRALLDPILKAWANTSDFMTLSDWAAAGHTVTFDLHQLDAAQAAVWGERIAVLEAFNGQNYATLKATGTTNVWTGSTRQRLLNESWAALDSSVYGALALQTRLKPYLDRIDLVIDESGMRWDGSGVQTLLAERRGVDAREALLDLADLSLHAEAALTAAGVDTQALLRTWISELPAGSTLPAELREMGVGLGFGTSANDVFDGTSSADEFHGAGGDDELLGNAGDDVLFGENGNDLLRGAAGHDTLDGGAGNDQLYGGNDHDHLLGGLGDDRLYGEAGNDVLRGGAGNDYLNGGAGSDTYLFGRGDGRDEIHNPDYAADAGLATQDTLRFLEGIDADQLWFRRVNTNLEVSIIGTDDTVRLNSWYGSTPLRIDAFETSSGQTLLSNQVDLLVQAMAAFSPPAPGQITLSQDQSAALTPVLAASWV